MKLYRIQRKDNKQFFVGWSHAYIATKNREYKPSVAKWADCGAFYRKLETIEMHLKWLCSDEKWNGSRRTLGFKRVTPKFDDTLLKLFNIVIDDVKVMGTEKISAHKLFGGK
jgi:hypothetical protein